MLLRPIAVATAIIFVALAVWHLGGRSPSLVVSYSTVDNDTLSTISGRDSDDIVATLPPSTPEPTPAPTTPAPLPLCESSVRVYEVFLFNKEIDMLEIRVAELFDVVDWFILCESTVNFQGGSKPLHFETLKHQLPARFLTKIKHHVCDIRRVEPHEDKWTRETLHHECMRSALIQHGMKHGDLAHLLDVDEIPFARSIANERRRVTNALCSDDTKDLPVDSNDPRMVAKRHHLEHQYPVRMNMPLFYMHLRNLHHIPWWTELHFSNNGNAGSMKRRTHTKRMEDSGGIHCSWCFRTVSDYQTKYKSYSHTEHNTEKSRDAALIRNCYCTNKFLRAHLNENTPHATIYSREDAIARFATSYMKQNLTKYAFLFPEQGPDCTLPD